MGFGSRWATFSSIFMVTFVAQSCSGLSLRSFVVILTMINALRNELIDLLCRRRSWKSFVYRNLWNLSGKTPLLLHFWILQGRFSYQSRSLETSSGSDNGSTGVWKFGSGGHLNNYNSITEHHRELKQVFKYSWKMPLQIPILSLLTHIQKFSGKTQFPVFDRFSVESRIFGEEKIGVNFCSYQSMEHSKVTYKSANHYRKFIDSGSSKTRTFTSDHF